jgi:hypothetical protein
MGVGMPEHLLLHEFGSQIMGAFDEVPYHVGSSLTKKRGWRDVDVRLMLPDDKYEAMGLGDPKHPHENPKWVSLVMAYSALGRQITGLPIDFQIQQFTLANELYPKGKTRIRSAIGFVPLRIERLNSK